MVRTYSAVHPSGLISSPYIGSYAGAGYLVTTLNVSSEATDYVRWLDLDQALAGAQWTNGNLTLTR